MRATNDQERDYVLVALSDATADNPRTGASLAKGLELHTGEVYSGAEIRAIIHELRMQGHAIVANSGGYWLSNDADDLERQARSLAYRAKAINRVSRALKAKAVSMRGTTR